MATDLFCTCRLWWRLERSYTQSLHSAHPNTPLGSGMSIGTAKLRFVAAAGVLQNVDSDSVGQLHMMTDYDGVHRLSLRRRVILLYCVT